MLMYMAHIKKKIKYFFCNINIIMMKNLKILDEKKFLNFVPMLAFSERILWNSSSWHLEKRLKILFVKFFFKIKFRARPILDKIFMSKLLLRPVLAIFRCFSWKFSFCSWNISSTCFTGWFDGHSYNKTAITDDRIIP